MSTAPISRDGHRLLLDYILEQWSHTRGFYYSEFLPKLWAIDRAYYVYRRARAKSADHAAEAANLCAENLERDNIALPIAVSGADTAASNLADTFLTGNPIFGVVAPPDQKDIIPVWEALFQYYTRVGNWQTELFNCFMSGIKYNMPIIDVDWKLNYEFAQAEGLTPSRRRDGMAPVPNGFIQMHSPDPYNLIWDMSIKPSYLSQSGTSGGYNRLMTRIQLKELVAAISLDEHRKQYSMNIQDAFDTSFPANYYNWKPPVSQFVAADKRQTNWLEWAFDTVNDASGKDGGRSIRYNDTDGLYLVTKIYLKIIPSDFGIKTQYSNVPRIYKVYMVNRQTIVYLEPLATPNNTLPLLLGDLQDDFFDYQSFSEVEKMFPYQDTGTELLNTRLRSAARALGDRAIYDPEYFNEGDINTSEEAAKIPLKKSLRLTNTNIDAVYRAQPYDHASTAGVMGDLEAVMALSRMHSGQNEFTQGQSRKGNRTLGEFQTTMQKQEVRQLRIPLRIEAMIMTPAKAHTKALTVQNANDTSLVNTKTRRLMQVSATDLRQTTVDFKLTTGLVNKGMHVNPELLITGLQTIQTNEELAMKYDVAEWFAYIMMMGGVPDVAEFQREEPTGAPAGVPAPQQPQQPPAQGGE